LQQRQKKKQMNPGMQSKPITNDANAGNAATAALAAAFSSSLELPVIR
jgi:hypothetical protein